LYKRGDFEKLSNVGRGFSSDKNKFPEFEHVKHARELEEDVFCELSLCLVKKLADE